MNSPSCPCGAIVGLSVLGAVEPRFSVLSKGAAVLIAFKLCQLCQIASCYPGPVYMANALNCLAQEWKSSRVASFSSLPGWNTVVDSLPIWYF